MSVPLEETMFVSPLESPQTNAIVGIPIAHIGKDDHVARVEALQYLNRVDRSAAKLDIDANCFRAVTGELEKADSGFGLAMNRPADIEHVLEIFEFDGAVDSEIRTRAGGKHV